MEAALALATRAGVGTPLSSCDSTSGACIGSFMSIALGASIVPGAPRIELSTSDHDSFWLLTPLRPRV